MKTNQAINIELDCIKNDGLVPIIKCGCGVVGALPAMIEHLINEHALFRYEAEICVQYSSQPLKLWLNRNWK